MPLELGVAIYRGRLDENQHDWLALIPEGPRLQSLRLGLSGSTRKYYNETYRDLI